MPYLATKRGSPHCLHGDEGEVVGGAAHNALYQGGLEGRVNAVPNGNDQGVERGAVSFHDEPVLPLCDGFGWRGFLGGCRRSRWRRLSQLDSWLPSPLSDLSPREALGVGGRRREGLLRSPWARPSGWW